MGVVTMASILTIVTAIVIATVIIVTVTITIANRHRIILVELGGVGARRGRARRCRRCRRARARRHCGLLSHGLRLAGAVISIVALHGGAVVRRWQLMVLLLWLLLLFAQSLGLDEP